jgi:hypothetical protein
VLVPGFAPSSPFAQGEALRVIVLVINFSLKVDYDMRTSTPAPFLTLSEVSQKAELINNFLSSGRKK